MQDPGGPIRVTLAPGALTSEVEARGAEGEECLSVVSPISDRNGERRKGVTVPSKL